MVVNFTKMHGLGNDFMVVDMISHHVHLRPEQIRRMADRNLGVGFDQLLLVEPPGKPDVDFRYRIFNADGSEVEQCGNGARCFAVFVREKKLSNKDSIRVETKKGDIELKVNDDGRVLVDMGEPVFDPESIPFTADAPADSYSIDVDGEPLQISAVSMGNPHAVLQVPELSDQQVAHLGPLIEAHERFPERVNVGFMEIVHKRFIQLRVYERGVGETLACGTGACAAVAAGISRGVLESPVEVRLPGGNLKIEWQGVGSPLMMEGPAMTVFEGKIRI
ncbi:MULTISPECIES: diaminopimelate epimerase [unclassified Oleiphilus]|jgi:diaminopimelate epimerase|nr:MULTISPECIES: diaminopimelate epimerase [unclassified Oleiphilus]KZY44837.1 diaminopimelate epimerase [Oleiphilus sp. HI0050]KZY78840.1 diaminopimelate epimerase [Oleiphilus sp. HI0069]KZY84715.1 diaminopimelate epimerase [Oleiphilus sp. HI0068]KZY88885.1 diaminopimelate epimerase [Oleiphilus sp. HI0072]KZZ09445.1 diaminopimelate epimerase [Oleiphilus sp. HI0078]KZZ24111.1 diaminopimelate epimerase [Oleiphilus sp. HI0081]KZZ47371.1 diaminopimelate epimerase [Oleiphilus sp. HI0085]